MEMRKAIFSKVDEDPSEYEGAVGVHEANGVVKEVNLAGVASAEENSNVQCSGGSMSSASPHHGVSTIFLSSFQFCS